MSTCRTCRYYPQRNPEELLPRLHGYAGCASGGAGDRISDAERSAIRGKISAGVAPVVLADENSTGNIALTANQVIHFTNTGNTYLVVNDIADIQIDQIRNDLVNIRQIHLPHVSAAEINAGTEIDARAMGPADIVSIINAHKPIDQLR